MFPILPKGRHAGFPDSGAVVGAVNCFCAASPTGTRSLIPPKSNKPSVAVTARECARSSDPQARHRIEAGLVAFSDLLTPPRRGRPRAGLSGAPPVMVQSPRADYGDTDCAGSASSLRRRPSWRPSRRSARCTSEVPRFSQCADSVCSENKDVTNITQAGSTLPKA